jgi:hypothetical protein
VEYSSTSNLSHRIERIKTTLEIFPSGLELFLIHSLADNFNDFSKEFRIRVKDNIELRKQLLDIELKDEIFEYLKDDNKTDFKNLFGMSFYEFGRAVLTYSINSQTIDNPDKIPCISDTHLKALSKQTKIAFKKIETLFNGITLRKEHYAYKKREIWNYTQQERSRKRPFILIIFNGKSWRLFSPKMLENRIDNIGEDMILSPLDRLPLEWQTNSLKRNFAQANTYFGKWFEKKTIELLKTINIIGFKPGNRIRLDAKNLLIMDLTVGPPDFIGYSEFDKSIIFIECKLLDCVFESRGIQGELSKFLGPQKENYIDSFLKKLNWLKNNKQKIIQAIEYSTKTSIPRDCSTINYSFVTYYPTTLKYFYNDIPSPTLFELVDLYKKRTRWPFEFGILK